MSRHVLYYFSHSPSAGHWSVSEKAENTTPHRSRSRPGRRGARRRRVAPVGPGPWATAHARHGAHEPREPRGRATRVLASWLYGAVYVYRGGEIEA